MSNNNSSAPGDYVKKSGAKEGMDKNEKHYISAWRSGKQCGFVSAIFSKDEKYPKEGEAKKGELKGDKWVRYRGKLTFRDQGRSQWVTGIWWPRIKKLSIPELGWVISPNGGVGGFFGVSKRPKDGSKKW